MESGVNASRVSDVATVTLSTAVPIPFLQFLGIPFLPFRSVENRRIPRNCETLRIIRRNSTTSHLCRSREVLIAAAHKSCLGERVRKRTVAEQKQRSGTAFAHEELARASARSQRALPISLARRFAALRVFVLRV